MVKPKATLKLMDEGFWGAKAMERRVIKCCADNPDCPFQESCYQQYVKFVDTGMPTTRRNGRVIGDPLKPDWPTTIGCARPASQVGKHPGR